MLCAATECVARPGNPPPFVPIERHYLQLPKGVSPFLPIFIDQGRDVLFQDEHDGAAWVIGTQGSAAQCVTCGFKDRPQTRDGFLYAFSDNKRLLLTKGLGTPGGGDSGPNADGWVLECEPTIRDCASHRFLPIDMSADRGKYPILQRRTWHLAPDSVHLGWMDVRADGTVMVVARLERREDRYVAADPRAVNPAGPTGVDDQNADHWENLSQLYELKSFTPDGKAILAVGLPANNVDVLRIDLMTGRTQRLTANPDWDEDSSLSPDEGSFVVNSWRPRHRLDAFAWIPQIRGFTGLMVGAAVAPYYVSTWTGFQCNLSPWLLPATGDDGGKILGQPLDTYADELTASNNIAGQQVWSPDSTTILLQEATRLPPPADPSPDRIAMARLMRAPASPVTISNSAVGAWAPPAALYQGPNSADRTVTVRGNVGGMATLSYSGFLGRDANTSVTFDHFTDDGVTYVDGAMKGQSSGHVWHLAANVVVSGQHTGRLNMDLTFDNGAQPLPTRMGTITAIYDGRAAPRLPEVAPCYADLPKPSPLLLKLRRSGGSLRATVTANIYGDVRPVVNAEVRLGSRRVRTDVQGHATLQAGDPNEHVVTAAAGDTFIPVTESIPSQ
jgi:hypothetical protein